MDMESCINGFGRNFSFTNGGQKINLTNDACSNSHHDWDWFITNTTNCWKRYLDNVCSGWCSCFHLDCNGIWTSEVRLDRKFNRFPKEVPFLKERDGQSPVSREGMNFGGKPKVVFCEFRHSVV